MKQDDRFLIIIYIMFMEGVILLFSSIFVYAGHLPH